MTHPFYLSDNQWKSIRPHLPDYKGHRPRVDDRLIISGIIHVLQSGCRWRDAPREYGPYTTLYNRYNRWSARGIWQYLFREIVAGLSDEIEVVALDSTHVKVHRCAGGGKRGLLFKPLASAGEDATPKSTLSATGNAAR
jgi:transposase